MDVAVAFVGAKDQKGEVDGPFYLTNTAGWGAVIRWAKGLGDRFHAIHKLTEDGACADTMRLAEEIQDAIEGSPANVTGILSQFLEYCGVGDSEETAVIVDGDPEEPDDSEDPGAPRTDGPARNRRKPLV